MQRSQAGRSADRIECRKDRTVQNVESSPDAYCESCMAVMLLTAGQGGVKCSHAWN